MSNDSHIKQRKFLSSRLLSAACLCLFFSYSGPLWAPAGPGWCKNNTIMTATANLAFGSFMTTDIGLINITPGGNQSYSGALTLIGGTVSPGVFDISGCANYAYSIVLPTSATLSSTTSSMTVNTFQTSPTGSGVLDASGAATLKLGATLHVGNPQPKGTYSGTFIVEIVVQ